MLLFGLLRRAWLDGALAGIALGMSMLPEEFPVVLTVFMAMGAMRMSRVRVLARRAASIETLGSATTLCTDKTGTLTQNRMTIAQLRLPDGRIFDGSADAAVSEDFWRLAELGILASAPQPFDPMEIAFHDFGARDAAAGLPHRQEAGWDLRRRYPLDPALLAVSHVWGIGGGDQLIATKGAPERSPSFAGWIWRRAPRSTPHLTRWRRRDCASSASPMHGGTRPSYRTARAGSTSPFKGLSGCRIRCALRCRTRCASAAVRASAS